MDFGIDKERPVVRLRGFRAIDEPETCRLFLQGHNHVLINFGIQMITSAKDDWMYNPTVFVFVVESLDKSKVYGGIRLHVANYVDRLPIEDAVGYMDSSIYPLVDSLTPGLTSEGCGLWNSREIAGYGIGSIFLTLAGFAGSSLLGVTSMFSLCAPYTVKMAQRMGYRVVEQIGNKGTFYYPKLDLVATAFLHQDMKQLKEADPKIRETILSLMENPQITRLETLRRNQIEIHYDLDLKKNSTWTIEELVEAARLRHQHQK